MKDLIADEVGRPNCVRPGAVHFPGLDICPSSLTPKSRNSCQVVASITGVPSAQDLGSATGSALKNVQVSPHTNVHQNAHQRIKKDRVGYVRIKLDTRCKCFIVRLLHSDSDPLLKIRVDSIGYGRIIPD
jgi:hypothetical protein